MRNHKPLWPRLASISLLLFCAGALFKRYLLSAAVQGFRVPGDFSVYLLAWQRAKEGLSPYVISDGSPYKYSPGILGLVAMLPSEQRSAWLAFGGMSLTSWVVAILLGIRIRTWGDFIRMGLGVALSWKGILECLDYGQLEFLLFFLAVAGAGLFFVSPLASGFLLGLLPAFKLPWLALFVPFFVKATELPAEKGSARVFTAKLVGGYLLAWLCWLWVIPLSLFGVARTRGMMQAWGALLRAQPHDLYVSNINQSILGAALRVFKPFEDSDRISFGVTLILSGILLGILLQRFRRSREVSRENVLAWGTPWLLFCQLVNPLAWRWGSVYAVGAPWGLDSGRPFTRKTKILLCCVAIFWALQQSPVVRALGFSHWTDLHAFNLVTLYWLALLFL